MKPEQFLKEIESAQKENRGADLSRANMSRADLHGADLYGANLYGADLHGADLHGADLYGAKGFFVTGPLGSRGDFLYSVLHDDGLRFKAGCFWGTQAELEAAITKTHGENAHASAYRAAIALHIACNVGETK